MFDVSKLIGYTQKLTILYVEDNQESRESTCLLLNQLFNKVVVAVDGKDGVEKFQENTINIIITDLNMPNLNGIGLIKQIRDIDKTVPIIVLSAHDEEELIEESLSLGAQGYLNKPIEMDKLFQNLYDLLK